MTDGPRPEHVVELHDASNETPLDALVALLHGRRVAVLTGAGISTESGIPD
ncbi:MAG: hypothetical protein H6723_20095, partial [Sandaracinus sp.]|nr:hypothetical protein [Sandaracinus sp.]